MASMMQEGQMIELDSALALDAARYSLPLANSPIYATALRHGAALWTQDEHFKDRPGREVVDEERRQRGKNVGIAQWHSSGGVSGAGDFSKFGRLLF